MLLYTHDCHVRMYTSYAEFTFISDKVNRDEAQTYCQLRGMQLASITSSAKNARAADACLDNYSCWIGLHKSGNGWAWPDGTAATYLNWSANPSGDGDCVELLPPYGETWNDLDCDLHKRAVLCESLIVDVCYIYLTRLIDILLPAILRRRRPRRCRS